MPVHTMNYSIAIEAGNDTTAYGVIVPDLPGCHSGADNADDVLRMAREAITAHIEVLVERGEDIPAASNVSDFDGNSDYVGFTWALVDIVLPGQP